MTPGRLYVANGHDLSGEIKCRGAASIRFFAPRVLYRTRSPTLVPVKAGDRVKTDQRDAEKFARCYRAGDLTAVWVPDAAREALRDLVWARLATERDQLRARYRLGKFLLRLGRRAPEGTTTSTGKYLAWVKQRRFEHSAQQATLLDYLHEVEHVAERIVRLERSIDGALESVPASQRAVITGLQCLRGVAKISAVMLLVSEFGQLSRFGSVRQLMGYLGMVSREHSSGARTQRGSISKAGSAHLRRIVTEAAWSYCHLPGLGSTLKARQSWASDEVKAIAWRAQHRRGCCWGRVKSSRRSSLRWAKSCWALSRRSVASSSA